MIAVRAAPRPPRLIRHRQHDPKHPAKHTTTDQIGQVHSSRVHGAHVVSFSRRITPRTPLTAHTLRARRGAGRVAIAPIPRDSLRRNMAEREEDAFDPEVTLARCGSCLEHHTHSSVDFDAAAKFGAAMGRELRRAAPHGPVRKDPAHVDVRDAARMLMWNAVRHCPRTPLKLQFVHIVSTQSTRIGAWCCLFECDRCETQTDASARSSRWCQSAY